MGSAKKTWQSTDTLPFGVISLITTNFPEYWQTLSYDAPSYRSQEEQQIAYDSVFFTLSKYTNTVLYPEKYYNTKLSNQKNRHHEKNIQITYYDNLCHVFSNDFPDNDYLSPFASFHISNDLILILFAKEREKLKREKEKYKVEYPNYGYSRADAIILKRGKVQDALNLFYSVSFDYGGYDKFFYIDKNAIIHIKYFRADEIDTYFFRYEKYQLSPQGKFVRYYDTDGLFSNNEEHGFVKNHTREGKWVEMKPNGFYDFHTEWGIPDNYTYLEAEYKDGLPIGEWKFYKLEQEYSEEDGKPIFSTRKKGKLLYTETYKDGELVKREFVKK